MALPDDIKALFSLGVTPPEPNDRPKRRYQVPAGLVPRVLELIDAKAVPGQKHVAHHALWSLMAARCPESNEGDSNWGIDIEGLHVYLSER